MIYIESVRDATPEEIKMYENYMVTSGDRQMVEEEKQLEKLPECACCGEKIQEDECYKVDGDLICKDCMDGMRVKTEYYVEDRKYGDY